MKGVVERKEGVHSSAIFKHCNFTNANVNLYNG